MGSYVNLSIRTDVFQQIIDAIMSYCSKLDNYRDIEEAVHLIDMLEELYNEDIDKQNIEFSQWIEYEKLFNERFKDEEGIINEKGMHEYKNFNKVYQVLEDYKEIETLDILDIKQEFFLVLDLINVMRDDDE